MRRSHPSHLPNNTFFSHQRLIMELLTIHLSSLPHLRRHPPCRHGDAGLARRLRVERRVPAPARLASDGAQRHARAQAAARRAGQRRALGEHRARRILARYGSCISFSNDLLRLSIIPVSCLFLSPSLQALTSPSRWLSTHPCVWVRWCRCPGSTATRTGCTLSRRCGAR